MAELISTTRASVAEGQSNAEALAMMLSEDVPALIVVRDGRPVGIVRRDVITARILVAVTAA